MICFSSLGIYFLSPSRSKGGRDLVGNRPLPANTCCWREPSDEARLVQDIERASKRSMQEGRQQTGRGENGPVMIEREAAGRYGNHGLWSQLPSGPASGRKVSAWLRHAVSLRRCGCFTTGSALPCLNVEAFCLDPICFSRDLIFPSAPVISYSFQLRPPRSGPSVSSFLRLPQPCYLRQGLQCLIKL